MEKYRTVVVLQGATYYNLIDVSSIPVDLVEIIEVVSVRVGNDDSDNLINLGTYKARDLNLIGCTRIY